MGQFEVSVRQKSDSLGELFPHVVGRSHAFLTLLQKLHRIAATDRSVLICGPTGSGKEVMAQLLHHHSPNASAPFLDVNCGALPEHLVEAELFGYARGAFTGAVSTHAGYFERVGTGTLFLDEIGELPITLQPKLLRVLESKVFRPLGSTELKYFHGRVVAATHRDLEALVRDGGFREDLYYRLAVFVLQLPGLDQRREDIPELIEHFAKLNPRRLSFTPEAIKLIQHQPWPGHIRQLRNLVDRLAILADDVHITADVLEAFLAPAQAAPSMPTDALADFLLALNGPDKLALAEWLLLDRAMHLSGGNKSGAARILGVSRKAVERRLIVRNTKGLDSQQCLDEARALIEKASFRQALPLVKRGLAQLNSLAVQPANPRMLFDFYRMLGVCLRSLDGWLSAGALQAYEAAFTAGNGVVDDGELTTLLFGIWTTQLMTMELGKARGTAQEMLQRAQMNDETGVSVEAHIAMANTLFWLGDSVETLACMERGGLLPVEQIRGSGSQGFDLIGLALMFEGLAAFQVGDFSRAQLARERLAQRAKDTQAHPLNCAIALQGEAWLSCLFEDMSALEPVAMALESMSQRHGLVFYRGVGQILRGTCLTAHMRFDEAQEAIREGYETHMLRNGGRLFYSFQTWKMGELLLSWGKAKESEQLMSHAMEVCLKHQERAYLGELLVVQGRARWAMGQLDEAEDSLRSAMSTALALGAVPARLSAVTYLAQLLCETARPVQARDCLSKVLSPLDKTQAFVGLQRALDLLRQLQK